MEVTDSRRDYMNNKCGMMYVHTMIDVEPGTTLNSPRSHMLLMSLADIYMRSWLTPPVSTERFAIVKMLLLFSFASVWSAVRLTSVTVLWNSLLAEISFHLDRNSFRSISQQK